MQRRAHHDCRVPSTSLRPSARALATHCGGIDFRNPVLTASGTFGYGKEFDGSDAPLVARRPGDQGHLPNPRFGNPAPRICETASGMLNSIGLENVGVEGFAAEKLPFLRTCGTKVLVNFFGTTFDDYVDCGQRWEAGWRRRSGDERVVPQHQGRRHRVRPRPQVLGDWSAPAARSCQALWVKLTPNTSDIVALARACAENGADAVSVINTITGMAIDARTRRPKTGDDLRWAVGTGHQAHRLRMVYQIHRAGLGIPICGIGGIQTGLDAVEFFLAGASTVQVGTQNFIDPASAERIVREVEEFCRQTAFPTCASSSEPSNQAASAHLYQNLQARNTSETFRR
jgi:dihydroorotate dehydrogenase (NAD+) catalytic subunit